MQVSCFYFYQKDGNKRFISIIKWEKKNVVFLIKTLKLKISHLHLNNFDRSINFNINF